MTWENESLPKWTTDIFVNGPIEIEHDITFRSRKDIEYGDPLYSNIVIRKERDRVKLSVNSFAEDAELGKKAAFIFSGLALDVLSVKTMSPLYISIYKKNQRYNSLANEVKRIITEDEWKFAFKESRLLTLTEPTFLRALGWYRKGLITEDPFDKFLAFWNSIEVVAGKYHTRTDRTQNGIKNQIWQCFQDLWGNIENWKLISGNQNWIDDNYQTRKDVAHGIISIDIDTIEAIVNKLQIIEKLAHIFLIEWRTQKLSPENNITLEIQEKLDEREWIRMQ